MNEVLETLDRIIHDDSVPRNVRKTAGEIKEDLLAGGDISLKAASAISILEDLSADPNLPMHVRTMIWNLVSNLERLTVQ
ncbi:UPF0147 family protein [Geoglobus acetivorans]|nr:hypothetical protein GACE_1992 [Geoglobus acetivorans]MBE8539554.1 UPF0147 family protein [Geoglobus acetivorans]